MEKQTPSIDSRLRHILRMPQEIYQASGIIVNGRRLKSFVFTTDLAIIRNCDADAVFAVYPFTPQQAISDAIIKYSYVPVFCGVGGGTTRGLRTVQLARDVESRSSALIFSKSSIGSRSSLPETSTMCTSRRQRSMCRRKSWPRPAPSAAPSIIPGISAMTNDTPSST